MRAEDVVDPNRWFRLSVVVAAACIGATTALPVAAQSVLTAAPLGPPAHLLNQRVLKGWADGVDRATAGRVKIDILAASPVAPTEVFDAVKRGVVDIALMSNGASKQKLELNSVVEYAGQTQTAVQASVAYQRLVQSWPALRREFDGVELLGVFTHGPGVALLKSPGQGAADDLAGLRLHAGGAGAASAVRDLGATPVPGPGPAAGQLLKEGLVDGTVTALESFTGFRLADAIKAVVTAPGGLYTAGFSLIVNPARWAALSPADRSGILSVSGEALARLAGQAWDDGDAAARSRMRDAGVVFTSLSSAGIERLQQATADRSTAWVAAAGARSAEARDALTAYKSDATARATN